MREGLIMTLEIRWIEDLLALEQENLFPKQRKYDTSHNLHLRVEFRTLKMRWVSKF